MTRMRPAVASNMTASSLLVGSLWLCMLLLPTHAKMEIGEDTMWDTNQNLTQQVLIKPGITLRIKGKSPQEAIIIDLKAEAKDVGGFLVSPGAKLEVENAVLTRAHQDVDFIAISYVDESQAVVSLTHVRCEKQSTCVVRFCCGGNEAFIQDSIFYKNKVALAGNGRMDDVKRSLFVENELAITNADWNVEDCVFLRNEQASNAENIRFARTIFIENVQAVSDPNGKPSPFLYDVLFYRNQRAVLPSLTDNGHSGMERVSFIENQSPIYAKSQLPPLTEVNFINSTEYDVVYAGTSATNIAPHIYWGKHENTGTIRAQIYDGLSGSKGGIVVVAEYSHEPFKHEMILFLLEHKPTPLIEDLSKYFGKDFKTDHHHGEHTAFDFGLLREWTEQDVDELVMETKAEMEDEPLVEVKDSETDGVVEIPQDVVAIQQETAPPVPEGNENPSNEESKQTAQESYDEHETIKHDEPAEPLDHSSAAELIHSYDDKGTILLVSLVLNTCLVWVLSVLAFDYFIRRRNKSGRYSLLNTQEKRDEEEFLVDDDVDNDVDDTVDDDVEESENLNQEKEDALFGLQRPKVHVV